MFPLVSFQAHSLVDVFNDTRCSSLVFLGAALSAHLHQTSYSHDLHSLCFCRWHRFGRLCRVQTYAPNIYLSVPMDFMNPFALLEFCSPKGIFVVRVTDQEFESLRPHLCTSISSRQTLHERPVSTSLRCCETMVVISFWCFHTKAKLECDLHPFLLVKEETVFPRVPMHPFKGSTRPGCPNRCSPPGTLRLDSSAGDSSSAPEPLSLGLLKFSSSCGKLRIRAVVDGVCPRALSRPH